MRGYTTKLRIIVPIWIEAESDEEAERIIDGVIDNAGEVYVYEGTAEDHDDALHGEKPERIERDDIERERDDAEPKEPTRTEIKKAVAEAALAGTLFKGSK